MIPGELFIKEARSSSMPAADGDAVSRQFRRPPDPGRLALSFFETNPALKFDRRRARGNAARYRGGHRGAVRAGANRDVQLVALAGKRVVYGFRGDVMGKL